MKLQYVVCPGEVRSRTDGQRHCIGAMQLILLYGVDPRKCRIFEPAKWWPESYYRYEAEKNRGLIELRPRFDGDYTLPTR